MSQRTNLASQQQLIDALRAPGGLPGATGRVRLIETHISWVLLAGRQAYKIKKSVDLGFLDFSTLALRQHFCEEEVRLNRRLAPEIYREVVAIGGTLAALQFGAQPVLEYAVRMRRFPAGRLFENLIAHQRLSPAHIDQLAQTLAEFHQRVPAATARSRFGKAAVLRREIADNFSAMQTLLPGASAETLRQLHARLQAELDVRSALMAARRQAGFVRECHGDLHLGNIVLSGGRPVPFDGIEFDPSLRWIDIIDDIAFPVMDLWQHDRPDLAWRLLNGWLEITGDFAGLALLPLYMANRALVRAKVHALRAAQPGLRPREVTTLQALARRYLDCAAQVLHLPPPALIITHGLPGSGKTTFSQTVLEHFGAIRLRSDVERKRLYGLPPLADSHRVLGGDALYSAEATARTYARLAELAAQLLVAGFRVIVDAAFLKREERRGFQMLARQQGVPFVIAEMTADMDVLRARIRQRQVIGRDASEADVAVLKKLAQSQEPLAREELSACIDGAAGGVAWTALAQRLAETAPP